MNNIIDESFLQYGCLIKNHPKANYISEELVNKYENTNILSDSIPILQYNMIEAINYCFALTKWKIIDVSTSKVVYTSGRYSYGDSFYFDFVERLGAKNGSQYFLKAAVMAGSDSTADSIIQVNSSINLTGVFWLQGTTFNNNLFFRTQY